MPEGAFLPPGVAKAGTSLSDASPSTQAHGDSAAAGSGTLASRADHKHAMPAAGGGSVTREGGQTTEATSTSTSQADLLTASSLTVAATQPFKFLANCRKSSGHASTVGFGLKLNSTDVQTTIAGALGIWTSSGANAAQDGMSVATFGARVTNYLKCAEGGTATFTTGGGEIYAQSLIAADEAALPTATITDVVLQSICTNGSNAVGADELHVYSLAAS